MPRWIDKDRTPLAQLRARAGFSMEKAAILIGVTSRTLARYENGINDIPLGIAENIAKLYNAPFDELRKAARDTKDMVEGKLLGRIKTKEEMKSND